MSRLPPGFEALEPFVEEWACIGEASRAHARSASTPALRNTFYRVATGLMAPALDYLDGRPIEALQDPETQLMRLMMSLANIAMTVETLGDAELEHAGARERMQLKDRSLF